MIQCVRWVSVILLLFMVPVRMQAQAGIVEAVKNAAAKIIKAVDLKVQRLQNETIWLQNAQKTLENALSKLKLQEISEWVEKQRTLYADYFDELYTIKTAIATYHRIKSMMDKQALLVREYRRAYDLFKADKHFTGEEIDYMGEVYQGILGESVRNLDQISVVIHAFAVQMSDAERLEIIHQAAEHIDHNYRALQEFNHQNSLLSLARAKDLDEAATIKAMYGL